MPEKGSHHPNLPETNSDSLSPNSQPTLPNEPVYKIMSGGSGEGLNQLRSESFARIVPLIGQRHANARRIRSAMTHARIRIRR